MSNLTRWQKSVIVTFRRPLSPQRTDATQIYVKRLDVIDREGGGQTSCDQAVEILRHYRYPAIFP